MDFRDVHSEDANFYRQFFICDLIMMQKAKHIQGAAVVKEDHRGKCQGSQKWDNCL